MNFWQNDLLFILLNGSFYCIYGVLSILKLSFYFIPKGAAAFDAFVILIKVFVVESYYCVVLPKPI
jgi:hypothetical protein